jgi:hypothetical protein
VCICAGDEAHAATHARTYVSNELSLFLTNCSVVDKLFLLSSGARSHCSGCCGRRFFSVEASRWLANAPPAHELSQPCSKFHKSTEVAAASTAAQAAERAAAAHAHILYLPQPPTPPHFSTCSASSKLFHWQNFTHAGRFTLLQTSRATPTHPHPHTTHTPPSRATRRRPRPVQLPPVTRHLLPSIGSTNSYLRSQK